MISSVFAKSAQRISLPCFVLRRNDRLIFFLKKKYHERQDAGEEIKKITLDRLLSERVYLRLVQRTWHY
jgi:hypothetical protein